MQGEGGDNHFRPEFFQELRRLADEHEFLLIYDEVQSGMGITGRMWAHEHYDVQPDVFAFGKKSQVCGIVAGKRVEEVEKTCLCRIQPDQFHLGRQSGGYGARHSLSGDH